MFRVDAAALDVFWQVRAGGVSYVEAAERAGVSARTGYRALRVVGGVRPRRAQPSSGRFLSFAEREQIALGWAAGLSRAEIARRLGRHRATVGRELDRNRTLSHRGGLVMRGAVSYLASTAQNKAQTRSRRPKSAKLKDNVVLRERVQDWLLLKWSPGQIAMTLRREFSDRPEMWVSHETIYQSLYVQSRGALRRELTACLRTGRAMRRPETACR